jgi:hypothetical protein
MEDFLGRYWSFTGDPIIVKNKTPKRVYKLEWDRRSRFEKLWFSIFPPLILAPIIQFSIFLISIPFQGNSEKLNINGSYERDCTGEYVNNPLFKVSNDSIVEFYEKDENNHKWKLSRKRNGEVIKGKIRLIDNNHVELDNQFSTEFWNGLDTFIIKDDGSLYREEKMSDAEKMKILEGNNLIIKKECEYKVLYKKLNSK